ncbi:hypothetical protein HPY23_26610, partial [Methylobacterium sp. IF7SW-B2]|nr:hypothetical protein [Methylobacterium ajmalii]
AIAAATAITKVAQQFDQLYFASQRVGASAGNIKAFSYGVSQLGGTAAGAQSSLENFARFMKMNPQGSEALLKQYGVTTRDANGQLRDRTKLLSDLGKSLNGKSFAVRSYIGEMFGIDEHTLTALGKNVDVFADQYRASMKRAGLDPDKAAADGNKLATTWRQIGAAIDIIGAKVTSRLFGTQDNVFKEFLDFLDRNGDKIAEIIEKIVKAVIALATALLKLLTSKEAKEFLDGILGTLGSVDEKTGKWEASIDSLQTALKVFAAYVLTTWVAKLLLAFRLVGGGWAGLLASFGIGGFAGAGLLAGAGIAGAATAAQLPGQVAKGNVDPATGGALDSNPMGDVGKENSGKLGRLYRKYAPTWLGGRKPNMRYGDKPGVGGGRAAGSGQIPALPDNIQMTADERNTLGLILKYESGGQNTMNYVGKGQGLDPATPKGYTAQGYFQMLNSNWRRIAPLYGIKTPNAMASSLEDQTKVALHLLRNGGVGNWANYNPRLKAALARGETAPVGGLLSTSPLAEPPKALKRPIGQATNISDEQVIAADDGHWGRTNKALASSLGDKDFAAMHANFSAAPNTNYNRSSNVTNSPTFNTTITGVNEVNSLGMTIDRSNRRLTKEFFERGVPQGAN